MLDRFRGTWRLPTRHEAKQREGFTLSAEASATPGATASAPAGPAPSWINEVRVLIPGDALAAYVALQPIATTAANPENVRIVLALVFLVVTIVLRWIGTAGQYGVVLISALAYIALVYATGGQIFWHRPFPDQALYAQIVAVALGLLGPAIWRNVFGR
jgi:hypothetical protein